MIHFSLLKRLFTIGACALILKHAGLDPTWAAPRLLRGVPPKTLDVQPAPAQAKEAPKDKKEIPLFLSDAPAQDEPPDPFVAQDRGSFDNPSPEDDPISLLSLANKSQPSEKDILDFALSSHKEPLYTPDVRSPGSGRSAASCSHSYASHSHPSSPLRTPLSPKPLKLSPLELYALALKKHLEALENSPDHASPTSGVSRLFSPSDDSDPCDPFPLLSHLPYVRAIGRVDAGPLGCARSAFLTPNPSPIHPRQEK